MNKNFILNSVLASVALALAAPVALAEDLTGKSGNNARFHGGDEILIQGFHWNVVRTANNNWYNILNTMTDQTGNSLKDLGVTSIWMPPPWRDWSSWSDATKGTSGGGEGYFWHDWNLNSQYGTASQLATLAAKLNTNGIKPIYDIVPNHRNRGVFNAENQYSYPGSKWRFGGTDNGDPFMNGDADLNTEDSTVWTDMKNAMNTLKNTYGAGGFRFDFVRGFPAAQVDSWMANTTDSGFCVGELWKAPDTQSQIKTWSDGAKCTVFDFALKTQINTGDITNLVYGLNGNPTADWRERAVTFIDNHDTGYSPGPNGGQHHWPAPDSIRDQAYAYILTSPGTPSVYWSDAFDWGRYAFLKSLIAVRKDAKVRAYSDIKFCISKAASNQQCARNNNQNGLVYVVNTGNTWSGKIVVGAIGSTMSNPNDVADGTFTLAASGSWGKIWVASSATTPIVVDPNPGTSVQRTMILIYAQTSSGQDMFVRGGIDHTWAQNNLSRTCTSSNMLCAVGHTIRNRLNNYTASWENGDSFMDWYGLQPGQGAGAEGTPFEWTTNNTSHYDSKNDRDGVAPTGYTDSGVGYFSGNTFGPHYWLWDVDLDCTNAVQVTGSSGTKVKLIEFKAYVKGGAGWEGNIDTNTFSINGETFTVYNTSSNNHYAVCGKLTKTSFNSNAMDVYTVPN